MTNNKILEISLLSVLFIILIITCIFTYNIMNEKPAIAKKDNTSYEIIKYYKYKNNINEIAKFNIPYQELVLQDLSLYETKLKTIDSYIKYYEENITIRYSNNANSTELENFCNSYNEIENEYEFLCKYASNKLTIKNTYNLIEIKNDVITTPKKYIKIIYNISNKISDITNYKLEEIKE